MKIIPKQKKFIYFIKSFAIWTDSCIYFTIIIIISTCITVWFRSFSWRLFGYKHVINTKKLVCFTLSFVFPLDFFDAAFGGGGASSSSLSDSLLLFKVFGSSESELSIYSFDFGFDIALFFYEKI